MVKNILELQRMVSLPHLSCLAQVRLVVEGSGVPDSLESLRYVLDTLPSV